MTWKHVLLIMIGGGVLIGGAFLHDSTAQQGGMMIIVGALGHAGAGGRMTDNHRKTDERKEPS